MPSLVVVYSPEEALSLLDLQVIDHQFPGSLVAVIGRADEGRVDGQRASFFSEDEVGLAAFERLIASMPISTVILRPGGFMKISPSVFTSIFAQSIPLFMQINLPRLQTYAFDVDYPRVGREVLFVYPGPFAPVTNGSRQRALGFFIALIKEGFRVKIVLNRSHASRGYTRFLRQFGVTVISFDNSPKVDLLFKRLRAFAKRRLRLDYYLPLFARLNSSASKGYWKVINDTAKKADVVIFSYAWMIPLGLKKNRSTRYVLDTIDVNYVRDALYYKDDGFYQKSFKKINKLIELFLLKKADCLIAISPGDAKLFRETDASLPVVEMIPSFDWVESKKTIYGGRTETFGFIGANMEANRKALEYVIHDFWPVVRRYRPNARLLIAGAISDHIAKVNGDKSGIIALGFVSSLRSFYASIDAAVSPVMIQGGINIKIVESIASGVPIAVNALGAKSIPASDLLYQIDESDLNNTIENFLKMADLANSDSEFRNRAAEQMRDTMKTSFYQGFTEALNGSAGT